MDECEPANSIGVLRPTLDKVAAVAAVAAGVRSSQRSRWIPVRVVLRCTHSIGPSWPFTAVVKTHRSPAESIVCRCRRCRSPTHHQHSDCWVGQADESGSQPRLNFFNNGSRKYLRTYRNFEVPQCKAHGAMLKSCLGILFDLNNLLGQRSQQ